VKSVQDMTPAEILDELARRSANRAAGRPLDYVAPEVLEAAAADQRKSDNVLEKAEQWAITKMARAIGFSVYTTSQTRAAKVTPGFPDLWLAHGERGFAGFWETKRQVGGRISHEQLTFGGECLAAKIPHGFGDRYAFVEWLTQHGFTPPPFPKD
jgi:hypothetical protein